MPRGRVAAYGPRQARHGTNAGYVAGCRCKPCRLAQNKHKREYINKRSATDPVYAARFTHLQRTARLRNTYGLSLADFDAMIEAQDRRCAICRRAFEDRRKMFVDHDHETGAVRGVLCPSCNTALGLFGDSLLMLDAASGYLIRHGKSRAK